MGHQQDELVVVSSGLFSMAVRLRWVHDSLGDFADVEVFLADHGLHPDAEAGGEVEGFELEEPEAGEVLAATWKEKRSELDRLQKSRRLAQAREAKKSFRVDVEEVRRRSKCWKCHKTGHWARDCRNKAVA